MSNLIATQKLIDGPRNFVMKIVGVLDTSDVAATGTIGTSATTTSGSAVVNFTAGALVPVVGQLVTATGGTGSGFPANAYILSIQSTTQITLNTPVVTGGTGWTITGTAGPIVIADPALMWPTPDVACSQMILDRVTYMVEPLLEVRIWWDATTPVYILDFTGAGHTPDYRRFGGLTNNAGAGKTGRVLLSTQGWTASAILNFTLTLEFVKQGT